jgi:hypothetical protein
MTVYHLREFQELVFRTYVRHLMFLATLPYHLLRETRRNRATAAGTRALVPAIQTRRRQ